MTYRIEYAKCDYYREDPICPCGNSVNGGGGYWPCIVTPGNPTASWIAPTVDGEWDGNLTACLECGRVLDYDAMILDLSATPDPDHPFFAPVVPNVRTIPGAFDDKIHT